ncbi:MAG TPA: SET domain-containing protein-lysine N-methyltransferase, partial [Spirochaetia bacterium]|nr:SET domain-containing protein-lysine N-methyltransferase [Spirochaetia bacterium]
MKRYETHSDKGRFAVKRSSIGLGLFAREPIRRGKLVIEYTGELLPAEEAYRRGGRYLFEVNSRWIVDGVGRENLSRYINHSCRPNCEP